MIKKYLLYVLRHKWFVFIECCKLGIPVRGLLHDLSKFRLSEFTSYLKFFYGDKTKTVSELEKIKDNFSKAWLLHLKRNPHHYQYWILNNDDGTIHCLEIPEKYIKEMVADWIGAGIAITGENNLDKWFKENKQNIITRMHPDSILILLELIKKQLDKI